MKRAAYVSMAAALLALPAAAQTEDVPPNSASDGIATVSSPGGNWTFGTVPCPGGGSGRVDLQAQTGNNGHLGIQYIPALDQYYASSRGEGAVPPHLVYKFDSAGVLLAGQEFNAVPETDSSAWGYRDMATDGTFLYAGWESGVARHNLDGSGGIVMIAGPAPGGVGTWRALAYDPTGDGGNGSLWTASFTSALIEVSMTGVLLNSFPQAGGWSLYGLAYDPFTGNLWGYSSPGRGSDVVEIDTTTGQEGRRYRPGCLPGTGGPSGVCQTNGGLTGVPGGAFGSTESSWDLVSLGQANSDSIIGTMIYCGPVCVPCDMNCDTDINALDIEPFIGLLFDGDDPCCGNRGDIGSSGDVNLDGRINAEDIEGFINCLFP